MIRYVVKVACRMRGDIGASSVREFRLSAPENASRKYILSAWLYAFGDDWELSHLVSYERISQ